jgi:hypothetical protein
MRRDVRDEDRGWIYDHITRDVRADDAEAFALLEEGQTYDDLPVSPASLPQRYLHRQVQAPRVGRARRRERTTRRRRAEVDAGERVVLHHRLPTRYGKDHDCPIDRNLLVAPPPSGSSVSAVDCNQVVAMASRPLKVVDSLV